MQNLETCRKFLVKKESQGHLVSTQVTLERNVSNYDFVYYL